MNKILLFALLFFCMTAQAKTIVVSSPDKRLQISIELKDKVYYAVSLNGTPLINNSPISMTMAGNKVLGANPKLVSSKINSVNTEIKPLYYKKAVVQDHYNELALQFKGGYKLLFRAYNDGAAYRFVTELPGQIKVMSEEATFNFSADNKAYFAEVKKLVNSFEEDYQIANISAIAENKYTYTPFMTVTDKGVKVAITEADLLDYAGMFLQKGQGTTFRGMFAAYPDKEVEGGYNNFNLLVPERKDYIAETSGKRAFPWRVIIVSDGEDSKLLENTLVYQLASPSKLSDEAWIKPGKVAWDWWSANILEGMDFKSGINTETYKYYIDFAARNGIEFVNIDDGWSASHDLLKAKPDVDMPYLVNYARQKNVGLFLWCVWHTLDKQLQPALDLFQKWGIAGVKVDFMDRNDQKAVNFYEKVAAEAAKRKILVNFHGAFPPTGLERTYPNQINREAVMGNEFNKFSERINPEHNLNLAYIRLLAGSMDYTPGSMRNVAPDHFKKVFTKPMTIGTRANQLAMFVVYYAPLQMLCDAPTSYEKEPGVLEFLQKVPTVWDDTKSIAGKMGEYVVLARRKGKDWYIGGMNNVKNTRQVPLKLDFLGNGEYEAEIIRDGANAAQSFTDYKKEIRQVSKNTVLDMHMSYAGGFVMRIYPILKR